ncbi:hypothetical protein [Natrinema sp. HArc-T2]|uniref:hypothetical protein n=1 Tax=Natrinema sp. HArc-T2 TaxID=3242701 RepID=UPI00359DB107
MNDNPDRTEADQPLNDEWPDPYIPANHEKFNDKFRNGLRHLQNRLEDPMVRPVAFGRNQNTVYIVLNEVELDADLWKEDTTDVYMSVPVNFGTGIPYGFVTHPPVNRTDGKPVSRQHRGRPDAQPLADALGVSNSDLSWWSYKWKGMTVSDGTDMTKGIGIIRRRLSEKEGHNA